MPPPFFKARLEIAAGGLALLMAILLVVFLNTSQCIIDTEFQWRFERAALLEGDLNQVLLVTKYEDHRKLFQEQTTQAELDANEFELGLALDRASQEFTSPLPEGLSISGSAWLVNQVRRLTGKSPLPTPQDLANTQKLYQAFQLEFNHRYTQALDAYAQLYATSSDTLLKGVIRLHQGFSSAMLDQPVMARAYYREVIASYANTRLQLVAELLLRHLNEFLLAEEALRSSTLPTLHKAKKMVQLMRCKEAARLLRTLPSDPRHEGERLLLQARCAEESGQREQAAHTYLKAIAASPSAHVAKEANRRLYLIAGRAQDSIAGLLQTAVQLNQALKDTVLHGFQEQQGLDSSLGQVSLPSQLALASREALERVPQATVDTSTPSLSVIARPVKAMPRLALSPAPERYTQGQRVQVRLQGGKEFSGMVLSPPTGNVLRLQTLIGVIGIPMDQIDTSARQE